MSYKHNLCPRSSGSLGQGIKPARSEELQPLLLSSPWRKGPPCLPDSHPTAMSCYDLCAPTSCGPTPLANSCNEPCVRQCQDSTYVIQPSPVVVTLPGPILSSFPQNTAVGSSASAAVGDALSAGGVPINSGSSSGLGSLGYSGLGGLYGRSYRRSNRCGP
ncbi:feather beta keratin-like [Serinus canaria]|uniref:feather beta keratin-like n=1 Tax=Serinus canaria TaxID=9135 RepID=UPI0008DB80FA|nr:feather beta keratin-like [Serinus canaria]